MKTGLRYVECGTLWERIFFYLGQCIQAGAERRFPDSDEGLHKWAPDCPVLTIVSYAPFIRADSALFRLT